MARDHDLQVRKFKNGRSWRIGSQAEVAWIESGTKHGVAITSAIPAVFDAYATVVLPVGDEHEDPDDQSRYERAVMSVLIQHTAEQPWWLGYLDTGSDDVIFADAPRVELYAGWCYVMVEAGPAQAAAWREEPSFKGELPDLMFPADRSWLLSTLWDDDWSCIGGPGR